MNGKTFHEYPERIGKINIIKMPNSAQKIPYIMFNKYSN